MSNLEKSVKVADRLESEVMAANNYSSPPNPHEYINALDKEGLIAPDLPEPELYGELAEFGDEEVFAARGTSKVRIYIGDARMSSESARELALMLLAAANYAETEHPS